ncbi:TetR/AcrR family transcriptional regulator [Nakamurella sp. GG22]
MREWVPVSTSPKGRLALTAVQAFGEQPFDEVTVGDLAAKAGVTTGALYHHFQSKLGLYLFVRGDVERRVLDRMEGAAGATTGRSEAVSAALLVGFDFAVRQNVPRLLGEPPGGSTDDQLVDFLALLCRPIPPPVAEVLVAGWRAALLAVAAGVPAEQARQALMAVQLRPDR